LAYTEIYCISYTVFCSVSGKLHTGDGVDTVHQTLSLSKYQDLRSMHLTTCFIEFGPSVQVGVKTASVCRTFD